MTDLEAAHILLSLTQIHEKDKERISNLRNNLLSRLRKRQFTEIDRKMTKKFLDLALLLRSGLPPLSVKPRIQDRFELISIREVSSDRINIDIQFQHFLSDFGYLQLITMASYVLAIKNLEEDLVYLIPGEDYDMVKEYFVQRTTAIPIRREKYYEFSVLGWAIATYVIISLGALLFSDLINLELKEKFGVLFAILTIYWQLFIGWFSKKFLPSIYKSLERYDLLKRILRLGDSNV